MLCRTCAALQGSVWEVVGSAARGAAGICLHDDASIVGIEVGTLIATYHKFRMSLHSNAGCSILGSCSCPVPNQATDVPNFYAVTSSAEG